MAKNEMYDDMYSKSEEEFIKKWHSSFTISQYTERNSSQSWTVMTKATTRGWLKTVELLIESGVNINQVDNFGDTALAEAIYTHRTDMIDFLLKRGADITIDNCRSLHKLYGMMDKECVMIKYLMKRFSVDLMMKCLSNAKLPDDQYRRKVFQILHTERLTYITMIFRDAPQYIILWITDWLPGATYLTEYQKIKIIEGVQRSINRIKKFEVETLFYD